MIHVGYVEEFAEADDLVMFLVDALITLQEILGPVYALVSTTTFGNTDTIVGIVGVIDLDQPLVIAGMELSELEGESPLLTHAALVLVGPANSLFPRNNILEVDVLWMTASFSVSSTMGIFQARSFVTRVIFALLGSSSPVIERMTLSTLLLVKSNGVLLRAAPRAGSMIL
jgi:hypothetical protein